MATILSKGRSVAARVRQMTASDTYSPIRSPIKWVGGKSRLRKRIIELMPAHTCYVEVFGGAGWVLFGKPPSKVEVFNDIDGELINFFRIIRNRPEEFLEAFEFELVSREEFERLAHIDLATLDEIQRARRLFYLIMAGWGGELNYPRLQTSISDGGHGNRLIGALERLKERIMPVHKRLSTVIIENLDWKYLIDRYDRVGAFMYIDPPYPDNGANYFYNMKSWESHIELSEKLKKSKARWMLSSYEEDRIKKLYEGEQFYIIPVKVSSGMNTEDNGDGRVVVNEVLIMNYPPLETKITPDSAQESALFGK